MYNLSLATGKQWQFHAWAGAGTLYLDEYREFNGGAGVTPDERMQFTYDALDRLVSTHKTTSEGYDQDFSYDPIGNLQTTSRTGNYWYASSVSNCAAGTPARKPHAVTSVEAGGGMVVYGDYAYDCNGNMTSRMELLPGGQAVTYARTWDAENRLTVVTNTATTPNAISKFVYDGDGARVMQIQISGTQMITTAYAGAIEVQITAT